MHGEVPDGEVPDARRRRAILIAVCVALMAVIASVSGLNVAQPDLAVAFDASQSTILWIINIYTLGLAALLLPFGALGDRLGRRPVLITGLVVFGAASAAAGLAPSAEVMLAARLLGGVGAAMIMPITLAVITSTFPRRSADGPSARGPRWPVAAASSACSSRRPSSTWRTGGGSSSSPSYSSPPPSS